MTVVFKTKQNGGLLLETAGQDKLETTGSPNRTLSISEERSLKKDMTFCIPNLEIKCFLSVDIIIMQ